ncbi:MAG: sigma-54 dependent transcriptional regulator [Myxococcota bacterium]
MTSTISQSSTAAFDQDRPAKVLVVDDEHLIRWSLRQRLEEEGFEIVEAAEGQEAISQFNQGCDLVLLDWLLPDVNGHDVLRQMRTRDPSTPIIMLTAHSSVQHAVDMMKEGAFHYAGKPFDLDEVVETVKRALESTRLRRELRRINKTDTEHPLVGESQAILEIRGLLDRVASSPSSTVLMTGESGTGKGLAAKSVHRSSERSSGPFMGLACSALPPHLLESELFGHEPGAFPEASTRKPGLLEKCQGGTVFLDDIGEMDQGVQAKLLRFLEEKTFRRMGGHEDQRADVRIIASTSQDLRAKVEAGRFREDLYYRLAVLTVRLPPLRDRKGDVQLLTKYFVEHFNEEFGKEIRGVSDEAAKTMEEHSWPGNVRELRNCIERAVLLGEGSLIEANGLELSDAPVESDGQYNLPASGVDMQELERRLLIQALERANGNRTRAGALLGMNRDQVRYRIEKFSLEDKDPKRRAES